MLALLLLDAFPRVMFSYYYNNAAAIFDSANAFFDHDNVGMPGMAIFFKVSQSQQNLLQSTWKPKQEIDSAYTLVIACCYGDQLIKILVLTQLVTIYQVTSSIFLLF